MYRGRFELDQNRAPLVSGGGKIKFAFDTHEAAVVAKSARLSSKAAKTAAVAASSVAATVPASTAAAVASPDAAVRIPAVLKFYKDEAEFHTERDLYQRMSRMSRGLYIPRMLASFEPLPDAPAGSDDALHCLAMEGGSESLRAKMVRKGAGGFSTMGMLPVAASVLAALSFIHGRGWIHGDIKPENLVAFADDYRLIDFDSACEVGLPLSLAFTAHYTPPEQAKRVLAARLAEREGKEAEVPELLADGSYDVWCLGAVLFEMRTGRPLFGSALTGDKERDVDAILASICEATDDSIAASIDALKDSSGLSGNGGIEHPLRENEASFLKKMLRVRVGGSRSNSRFTVPDLAIVLQEEILNGMTSTQQTRSWTAQLRGLNDAVVATHVDVRSANSKLSVVEQQQQQAGAQLRKIEDGVNEVGAGVAKVIEGQEGMNVSLEEILTSCHKLEEQAQKTLRAVFDVHETDMLRLFSLLPDQLNDERKPLKPGEWRSLKVQFSRAWADVSRQVEQASRDLMPFHYFRLTFICEAADQGGGCTAHAGYVVKQPTVWMIKQLLPVLKVANTLIKVAAIVGKAAGYPIPVDKLPFIDDIKDTALWTSLDRWYEHAGGQASGPPAVAASSQSAVAASAKSASPPTSAFHDAYVACRQLLEANDIATLNRHEPLGGLHRVQAMNGGVRWVCQGHAERCFPDGHEIDAPLPASLGSPAASGGASGYPSSSLAQQLESVKAEAAQREAQLKAEAAQLKVEDTRREAEAAQREASLRAENEQLQRRLAGVNPTALAATAAPSNNAATTSDSDDNEMCPCCVIC